MSTWDTTEEPGRSDKLLPLAIGLNLIFPGLGYAYLGRWVLGIGAALVVMAAIAVVGFLLYIPVLIAMNIIMAIDMYVLFKRKEKALLAASTMQCPYCAEVIKREAKLCRFCSSTL